jgi:predicted transcriptional regulator
MNTDHPIAEELRSIIGSIIGEESKVDAISERVMLMLDRERLLYYSDPGRVQIMNNHGRVLLAILEDPGITQRALSVYLRVSESNVQKSLRMLLDDGIISKGKQGNRNTYRFNHQKGLSHPDVKRLLSNLLPLLAGSSATQKTSHQQSE